LRTQSSTVAGRLACVSPSFASQIHPQSKASRKLANQIHHPRHHERSASCHSQQIADARHYVTATLARSSSPILIFHLSSFPPSMSTRRAGCLNAPSSRQISPDLHVPSPKSQLPTHNSQLSTPNSQLCSQLLISHLLTHNRVASGNSAACRVCLRDPSSELSIDLEISILNSQSSLTRGCT
jgi:hypothetical protein